VAEHQAASVEEADLPADSNLDQVEEEEEDISAISTDHQVVEVVDSVVQAGMIAIISECDIEHHLSSLGIEKEMGKYRSKYVTTISSFHGYVIQVLVYLHH
jgi:hypothetical protein